MLTREGAFTDKTQGTRAMSDATSAFKEWDAFVRLLSSDPAILDVLLRGARRRYKASAGRSISDPTPAERAEAWREAAREVG